MAKTKKSRKPLNSPLLQQRLRAWQPVLSPPWVIASFFAIFLLFISLGIVILISTLNIVEVEFDYTKACTPTLNVTTSAKHCTVAKSEIVKIPKKMEQPIYMYYKLEGFYQNHRQYAESRNDQQLIGKKIKASTATSSCGPISTFGSDSKNSDAPESDVYSPCGLVAWSMFNDSISLYNSNNELICNGKTPDDTKCTKNGISWKSDRDVKFKWEPGNGNRQYPQTYYNEPSHVIPKTDDEDFIVWMRTAALPNFRKLYRIIKVDLPEGDYYFNIDYNYLATPYHDTSDYIFNKKIVLTTTSWIGGKNLFLAIAYLSVAGVCLFLCGVFLIGALIQRIKERI